MSKSVMYFGIDVGASELWISVLGKGSRMFAHTQAGIQALHDWSLKQSKGLAVHLCMEATGIYSRHVAIELHTLSGVDISIVNPARIKAFANAQMRRCKTDAVDCDVIRCFAESQHPVIWNPEPIVMQQLRQLVTEADALKATLMQWRNRRHSHRFTNNLSPAVIKSQRAMERSIARQLQNIEGAIEKLYCENAELAEQINRLETIPGIARNAASRLLAYGGDWLTKRSTKELTAHAGLAPHHHQSGTSVRGKSKIDKRGNRRLRKTLFMPTLTGIVWNPSLKRFYQHLLKKGKPKMVAITACMKKLLMIIRAMMINKTTYKPNYQLDI